MLLKTIFPSRFHKQKVFLSCSEAFVEDEWLNLRLGGVCINSAHSFITQICVCEVQCEVESSSSLVSPSARLTCIDVNSSRRSPFAHRSLLCSQRDTKHAEHLICGLFGKSFDFHGLCGWLVCLSFQACVSICVFTLEVDEVQRENM